MNLIFEICAFAVNMIFLVAAFLKEFQRDLAKLGIAQNILVLLDPLGALHAEFIQLRSQQIRRAAGDGFLVTDDLLAELVGSMGAGVLPYSPLTRPLNSLVTSLVPLAGDDVEDSLGSDDLRGRGNQRGVTRVFAHTRNFLQNLFQLVFLARLFELGQQV